MAGVHELSFPRAGRGDTGAYLCIASNGIPAAVSNRIYLDVQCESVTT